MYRDQQRETDSAGREPARGAGFLCVGHRPATDILKEASKRLAITGLVMAILALINLGYHVVDTLVGGLEPGIPYTFLYASNGLVIAMSLVLVMFSGSRRLSLQSKLDIGLGYEVLLAAVIGFYPQLLPGPVFLPQWGASWVCIVILFFPVVAPNSRAKVFISSVIAASMDPLGIWAGGLLGKQIPSLGEIVNAYRFNYLCACVALVEAHVLFQLVRTLHAARETGTYRLVEFLGHGSLGEVWRAEHRLLRRSVAVKIIRPDGLGLPAEDAHRMLRKFEQEARAAAALRSPHVAQVYDFGINREGIFYYVMELLEGVHLAAVVKRFGPQPAERVVHVMRQACHSLQNAHSNGLLHQNMKPANIFLCRVGEEYDFIKLLDFGIVRAKTERSLTEDPSTALSADLEIRGFIAPEIIRGDGNVDGRADIYSLGCNAYYFLTGQPVSGGNTPVRIVDRRAEEVTLRLSALGEVTIPQEVKQIIQRCLEQEPKKRFASAKELSQVLDEVTLPDPWTNERARLWWEVHSPRAESEHDTPGSHSLPIQ